jgi:hypothetical protein
MSGKARTAVRDATQERMLVLVAGALMTAGVVLSVMAGQAHPHREAPNSHPEVFEEYAGSTAWTWVHFLQFAAAAIVVAGLVTLYAAMLARGRPSLVGLLGVSAGIVTVAVFAVNMAVDGIALKRAVDAWVAAPAGEKATRFAAAETVRWLEWGSNAFFQLMLGVTLGLLGVAIVRTAVVARTLGWISVVAGLALAVNGVLTGYHGFAGTPFGTAAMLLVLVMSVGVLVAGWRGDGPGSSTSASRPTAHRLGI